MDDSKKLGVLLVIRTLLNAGIIEGLYVGIGVYSKADNEVYTEEEEEWQRYLKPLARYKH
jgi:hypothetical protein